jgi:hypothetical protein
MFVTVPVTVAACANAPANKKLNPKTPAKVRINFISCLCPSFRADRTAVP